MTIIQPNRRRGRVSSIAFIGATLFIGLAILGVFFYNRNVELRFSLENLNKEKIVLYAENAELKNELYEKLDFDDVDRLAAKFGLVKETSPDYFLAFQ